MKAGLHQSKDKAGRSSRESGSVISLTAISLFALIAITALALEGSRLLTFRIRQQNAAELAAIGALKNLPVNSAATVTYGCYNPPNFTAQVCADMTFNAAEARITSGSTLTMILGSIFGTQSVKVEPRALVVRDGNKLRVVRS